MQYFFRRILLIFLISLLFFSCSKTEFTKLSDNIQIEENLFNTDLNGFSASISNEGAILENLRNGKIILDEKLSAGTIYISNCKNINVEVFSNSLIILGGSTEINNLLIHNNPRICTTLNKSEKKNGYEHLIKMLIIDFGKRPVIDGCKIASLRILEQQEIAEKHPEISTINTTQSEEKKSEKIIGETKNITSNIKEKKQIVTTKKEIPVVKELILTQDKSYEGNGVRILIENPPKDAEELCVIRAYKNSSNQVTYLNAKYNREFYSNSYTYEFANAGEESRFIFNYSKYDKSQNKTVIIESKSITVIPEKGEEAYVNTKNAELEIDQNTLDVKWITPPQTNLPETAELIFNVWTSQNGWLKLGEYKIKLGNPFCYDNFNLYTDPIYHSLRHLKNDKIFLTVVYFYNGCEWNVLTTNTVNVDPTKF